MTLRGPVYTNREAHGLKAISEKLGFIWPSPYPPNDNSIMITYSSQVVSHVNRLLF